MSPKTVIPVLNVIRIMNQANELNYNNGDVIIFDNFGDIFQSSETSGQYKVKASLTDLNAVLLLVCQKGTMKARIRDVDYEVGVGQGLVLLPMVIIQQLLVTPDVHFRGFGFSITAMENVFHNYRTTWQDALTLANHPMVTLSDGQMQVAENLYMIAQQAERMDNCRYYRPMMRAVVQAFLYMIADVVRQRGQNDEDEGMTQKERLFKQFVSLLWTSGGKNRKVDYFAQQLCITPKYLATLVRESSGKTPLEMIHRYTANMIAQLLRSTNLTIKEICAELEFPNESFFGRFVKKHLGCTPCEYRNKMRQTSAMITS